MARVNMSFEVKRPIFAHDFVNPPNEQTSCDIDINLINPSGSINLNKEAPGVQTRYLLTVSDSSLIGLSSYEQVIVERAIKDLVLSFNLSLVRVSLSTLQGDLPSTEVKFHPKETKVKIEQTSEGINVRIAETLRMRGEAHVTIGTHDELDEKQALANLEKIIKVKRFKPPSNSSLKAVNLGKALNAYESAMSTFDRLRVFKNLYNTIEFCANWNGVNRTGSSLDSLVASISNVQQADVCYWRRFNARTKHVDRTPIDASKYIQGMERVSSILQSIREATKQLIIDRLNIN